ncbi:MAG: CPBP family intramembrane glutamic endopeptidase [Paracoccaceae bacterium]
MRADRQGDAPWFFGLVLILSLPFYALGFTSQALPLAPALPISALMACVPMIAGLVLVTRRSDVGAASALFASAFRFRTIPNPLWALVALGWMPVAFLVTGGIVWLTSATLPTLHPFPPSVVFSSFVLFFFGAVAEEIGWQGYAFPALVVRHSALTAALIIGVVWALWHVVPFLLLGRSATWIIWHGLAMLLMRIIIVWLVAHAGQSILIAVLFHMMSNSVWGLYADFGYYYNPLVMCLVLLAPVGAVLFLWGASTGARFKPR